MYPLVQTSELHSPRPAYSREAVVGVQVDQVVGPSGSLQFDGENTIDKLRRSDLLLSRSCFGFRTIHPPPPPPTHHHHPQQLFLAVVGSEHVRTLFDSTQSQESISETHEFYAAMCIKTHLANALYLSSLWSDLTM